MIRNLKVLLAAATALAAFGALSATAHAAEEFHCSVEPCTATLLPDETAGTSTAHHVFVVKGAFGSVSFICDQLTGEATTSIKTVEELTFTNLKYENAKGEHSCKTGISPFVTVNFTSCDYNFKSLNGAISAAQIHVLCSTIGDAIDLNIKGTLCLQITSFTSTGLGYKTIGTAPNRYVTATAKVPVPAAALDLKNTGNPNCAPLNSIGSLTSSEYTTGNTLVTGETDPGGASADGWFE